MNPSLLVTGAAGCVGRALLDHLGRERVRVVGLDISPRPKDLHVADWIRADILDSGSYGKHLPGVDTVIHLAAKAHSVPRSAAEAGEFWKTNQEGTGKVVRAAAEAGVRRLVFVSTVAVFSAPGRSVANAYAESKRAAEGETLTWKDRMEIVVVRPATVYGPNDRGNIFRLIRWIDRGLPPIIGSGENRKSMVFARNLAAAITYLADRGENGQTYVVTDGCDMSMKEIVASICCALGVSNRWPRVPLRVAKTASRINEWLAGKVGFPLVLGEEAIEKLVEETVYDPVLLFSLGFSPPYDFQEGIEETVRWYRRSVP